VSNGLAGGVLGVHGEGTLQVLIRQTLQEATGSNLPTVRNSTTTRYHHRKDGERLIELIVIDGYPICKQIAFLLNSVRQDAISLVEARVTREQYSTH
jgi:hypothetical protein